MGGTEDQTAEYSSLVVASIERVRGLLEDLRLMPLGVSRSEAYGIVERWQDDGGTIRYGRDLAEWIGPEDDETAANFTELIVLALNMLPTLLRAYQDSAACASGKERPLDAELGAGARTPHQPAPAVIDDREWVAWGFANLTLPEAIRRLRAVNADRKARGEQPLGEPPFTGEGT